MISLESSLLSTVASFIAGILAISLFVQVLQEIWKYLRGSRGRIYTNVLEDFLGPWAQRMTKTGVLPDLEARGPLQFRRIAPSGVLLPLQKEHLIEGLERTASPWHRRTMRTLKLEVELQNGKPQRQSSEWDRLLAQLREADVPARRQELATARTDALGGYDYRLAELAPLFAEAVRGIGERITTAGVDAQTRDVGEIRAFLSKEVEKFSGGDSDGIDAARILHVYREHFFSYIVDAERNYGRLEELSEYRWRRYNLRTTFVFGVLTAVLLAQPAQDILARSRSLSAADATALATSVTDLYEAQQRTVAAPTGVPARDSLGLTEAQLRQMLGYAMRALDTASFDLDLNGLGRLSELRSKPMTDIIWYALGCLVTALLVSFGAPFWNDLLGAVLRIKKGSPERVGDPNRPPLQAADRD